MGKPAQTDLFGVPAAKQDPLRGMVRRTDAEEPRIAAAKHVDSRSALQQQIFDLLKANPMTDLELENHPSFSKYGYSTVRKRRSELFKAGQLERAGRRDGLAVWKVKHG